MMRCGSVIAALILAACESGVPMGTPGPEPTTGFVAVAAGEKFSCGIQTSNDVLCWGENDHGQLGEGTNTERTTPTPVGD